MNYFCKTFYRRCLTVFWICLEFWIYQGSKYAQVLNVLFPKDKKRLESTLGSCIIYYSSLVIRISIRKIPLETVKRICYSLLLTFEHIWDAHKLNHPCGTSMSLYENHHKNVWNAQSWQFIRYPQLKRLRHRKWTKKLKISEYLLFLKSKNTVFFYIKHGKTIFEFTFEISWFFSMK